MAKIKVTSKCEMYDGMSITFQAPCDCTAVDGLTVSDTKGNQQTFTFRDALNADMAGVENVFVEGAYMTAVLSTRTGFAYLQNPATNAHLEYQSFTKDETLMDLTKSLYGLDSSATPNDIFMSLKMPAGYYGFAVTAKFSDGSPASGLELKGLLAFDGSVAVTDETGFCFAMTTNLEQTVDFTNYLGIVSKTETLVINTRKVYTPVEITVERDTTMHTYTASGEVRTYSGALIDVCAVGGGGGGGGNSVGSIYAAVGGGGGYTVNAFGVQGGDVYTLSIGAGGAGGNINSRPSSYYGAAGGTTTVTANGSTIVTATGGGGGNRCGEVADATGIGNGNGAWYRSSDRRRYSSLGTVYVFNDSSLPLPGGGGGSGTLSASGFGGAGAADNRASNGRCPGGGGGGIGADPDTQYCYGGDGGAGAVYMRARYA